MPVQTVADFAAKKDDSDNTDPSPPSSYRLGVKRAPLHSLYPPPITSALTSALKTFNKKLPGYSSSSALLHGVETRTSSPLRIPRDRATYMTTTTNLFVAGEGAGYAGGIVSAAADGVGCAVAIARLLGGEAAAEVIVRGAGLEEGELAGKKENSY